MSSNTSSWRLMRTGSPVVKNRVSEDVSIWPVTRWTWRATASAGSTMTAVGAARRIDLAKNG